MKAIVLAAGIGSRLRPITLGKPKCCVTVGSKPVLSRQLYAYADAGVTEVIVVAGYLAERTRSVCREVSGAYPDVEITVLTNDIYANTDNMYSLSLAADAVAGEPFLLSNGDVVFDPGLVAELLSSDAGSAIAVDTTAFSGEAMKVTLDGRGRIDAIDKDLPEADAYAVSTDVYRFSAEFSAALFDEVVGTIEREGEYGDWTEAAIDRVLGRRDHDVEPVDVAGHRWVEIDDRGDLLRADVTFAPLGDLGAKEAVFFDLDGTLYLDGDAVDGATNVVAGLRERGVDVYFLSNNSSKRKPAYVSRLESMGVAATPEAVLLSTDGVIEYLEAAGAERAYVVGTAAMREAFAERGIDPAADDPEHVVVGFDTELTYGKVRRATLAIRDGASFLLAHPDAACPTAEGLVPDAGAIGALVETAADRQPDRVFGKPNPGMVTHVMEAGGYEPGDVLVVGDRLATDVALADNLGCESVCVLTGDADRPGIEAAEREPTMIAPDVGYLAGRIGTAGRVDATVPPAESTESD